MPSVPTMWCSCNHRHVGKAVSVLAFPPLSKQLSLKVLKGWVGQYHIEGQTFNLCFLAGGNTRRVVEDTPGKASPFLRLCIPCRVVVSRGSG